MNSNSRPLAEKFAFVTIRGVARIVLPLGVGFGIFSKIAKSAFVRAAADQIQNRGDRVSSARIAALTGLSRQDVARIRLESEPPAARASLQRTERVMYGWFNDRRFLGVDGQPKPLPVTGDVSFTELVRAYSGDIPRKAVLEELLAGGMATIDGSGSVIALRQHYATKSGDPVDLPSVTADAEALLDVIAGESGKKHASFRRISVAFPTRNASAVVRKTIAIRVERFLEGLSDYLHTESAASSRGQRIDACDNTVVSVLVAKHESSGSP